MPKGTLIFTPKKKDTLIFNKCADVTRPLLQLNLDDDQPHVPFNKADITA